MPRVAIAQARDEVGRVREGPAGLARARMRHLRRAVASDFDVAVALVALGRPSALRVSGEQGAFELGLPPLHGDSIIGFE